MARYGLKDDGVHLRLHSGVTAGRVTGIHVGGHAGRWEYLIKGPPLREMKEVAGESKIGEITVSKKIALMCAHCLDTEPLSEHCHLLRGMRETCAANALSLGKLSRFIKMDRYDTNIVLLAVMKGHLFDLILI